jgi:hypothetical protein
MKLPRVEPRADSRRLGAVLVLTSPCPSGIVRTLNKRRCLDVRL